VTAHEHKLSGCLLISFDFLPSKQISSVLVQHIIPFSFSDLGSSATAYSFTLKDYYQKIKTG